MLVLILICVGVGVSTTVATVFLTNLSVKADKSNE